MTLDGDTAAAGVAGVVEVAESVEHPTKAMHVTTLIPTEASGERAIRGCHCGSGVLPSPARVASGMYATTPVEGAGAGPPYLALSRGDHGANGVTFGRCRT